MCNQMSHSLSTLEVDGKVECLKILLFSLAAGLTRIIQSVTNGDTA
jgi:hypothetical protein